MGVGPERDWVCAGFFLLGAGFQRPPESCPPEPECPGSPAVVWEPRAACSRARGCPTDRSHWVGALHGWLSQKPQHVGGSLGPRRVSSALFPPTAPAAWWLPFPHQCSYLGR